LLLFDEAMQQHGFFINHGEQRPRDAVWQARTDFPNAVAQIVHERLADRPRVLHGQNVRAYGLALFGGQAF
jgi:hypothetical protein